MRHHSGTISPQVAGWLAIGGLVTSLAVACGSSDEKVNVPNAGGDGGDGQTTVPGAGRGATSGVTDAAGAGGAPTSQAGSGGSGLGDGGVAAQGGASAGTGPVTDAGASSDAGAGGAGPACGGCCSVNDCPGDGYLCTDNRCVDVAGSLSGLLWKLPCTSEHTGTSCSSAPTVTVTSTLGGVTGVTYDVQLHFRGVVERKTYSGGCSDGSYWQIGGADNGDIANVYQLQVSSPPQTYFLNAATSVIDVVAIDFVKTIRIDAGATVTLYAASKDDAEQYNHDANGVPVSVAGTSLAQPFDGQFIQMDVEAVTPDAIGTGSAIGGGTSGSALSFSGAQLVTVADDSALHPASLTQEAWFELEGALGGYNAIAGKSYGAGIGDSYTLWFESGELRAYVEANGAAALTLPWNKTKEWHHMAFTYDTVAQRRALYIDGGLVACGAANGAVSYDTHPMLLGADSDNGALSGFWNGKLDEVRLFSTARTADQVWADLHTHKLGATTGLVGEWTFDDADGQVAADSSGNGLDAVLGSANTVEASDPTWVAGR